MAESFHYFVTAWPVHVTTGNIIDGFRNFNPLTPTVAI